MILGDEVEDPKLRGAGYGSVTGGREEDYEDDERDCVLKFCKTRESYFLKAKDSTFHLSSLQFFNSKSPKPLCTPVS